MKNFSFDCKHFDSLFCIPPGAHEDILEHPTGNENLSLERAVIKEHRFAFYYWGKWTSKLRRTSGSDIIPDLLSIDFHDDLHEPTETEQEELKSLDLNNLEEVAKFTWSRLNILNDGHIKSALYKNVIGDVFVMCKMVDEYSSYDYKDYQGNIHKIHVFNDIAMFIDKVLSITPENVYFDIDLDYFVKKEGNLFHGIPYKLESSQYIKSIINPTSDFMKWIFQRMRGFTIATEPEHCGGIRNSIWILKIIEDQLFTNIYTWKHLE